MSVRLRAISAIANADPLQADAHFKIIGVAAGIPAQAGSIAGGLAVAAGCAGAASADPPE